MKVISGQDAPRHLRVLPQAGAVRRQRDGHGGLPVPREPAAAGLAADHGRV